MALAGEVRTMRGSPVRFVAFSLLLLALVVAADPFAATPAGVPDERAAPVDPALVTTGSMEGALWPHTSRRAAFDGRTLAINVLVYGDADAVERYLRRTTDADWDRPPGRRPGLPWRDAHGAVRYTYVAVNGTGRWLPQTYQLQAGTYLGRRYHVRAYAAPPPAAWTALQVHEEYWDWFRLRHTVTDVAGAREAVEREAADDPAVGRITRLKLDDDHAVTVLELAAAAFGLLVPTVARRGVGRLRRRLDGGAGLLASAGAVYLGVRVAGIGLERALPAVPPKAVAAVLYPVVAAGIPLSVWAAARDERPTPAALLPPAGLGIALLAEYVALGTLPPFGSILPHRAALLLSIGLLGAGAARSPDVGRSPHGSLALGAIGWILALMAPLAGWV